MNERNPTQWMVCVRCITFNHASYIVDTMNGFTMQQTSFPYVCYILDDASTDGEPEVIRKYLHENFDLEDKSIVRNEETDDYTLCFAQHKTNKNCYFAVLWLKYNHHSIKKSKNQYVSEWHDNAKYIAMCEGDDYWTSSEKLSKQVCALEKKPNCFLSAHNHYNLKGNGEKTVQNKLSDNTLFSFKDVLFGDGNSIATSSMLYRNTISSDNYPDWWKKSPVGDAPLKLYFSYLGDVYFISEIMSVYRRETEGSWSSKYHGSISYQIKHNIRICRMYRSFNTWSNGKYSYLIWKKIIQLSYRTTRNTINMLIRK